MQYTVIKSQRKTIALEIKDGEILVRAPLRAKKRDIEQFVAKNEAWLLRQLARQEALAQKTADIRPLSEEELAALKERAGSVFPERVAFYAPQIAVNPQRITIRAQKTKWGSCSSKNNLNFNCLLLLAPPEVLDSVVVHELCHLKHMDHSARFYEEVLRICPGYHRCERWLKEHGAELLARLPASARKKE